MWRPFFPCANFRSDNMVSSKCDLERTRYISQVLASSPLATMLYVIVCGTILCSPILLGKVAADYGYILPGTPCEPNKDPYHWCVGGFTYIYAFLTACAIGPFVSIWYQCGFLYAFACYISVPIVLCIALGAFYLWGKLNYYLLESGWLYHICSARDGGIRGDVVLWCFIQAASLMGAAVIISILINTWEHYRHHLNAFDASRNNKKTE